MTEQTYAGAAKQALCSLPLGDDREILAEAYGILLFCNRFSATQLRIVTQSVPFSQRLTRLFRLAFEVDFDRVPAEGHPGRLIFEITDRDKLRHILEVCQYDISQLISMHVNFALLESADTRMAFLRGAFLAGGSVTDPSRLYHLEISTTRSAVSRELLSVMEECGLRAKTTFRKGNYLVYFKQSTEIARFLQLLGAESAAHLIHSAREEKVSINRANRCSNCDMANLDKTVAAAQEQLSAIRHLEESGRLKHLPDKLQEAARLRRDYPELSLVQLGELCDPPVTKSAFNYRLKKLTELSAQKGQRALD